MTMVSLWAKHGQDPDLRLEHNFLADFTDSRRHNHHITWRWMDKIENKF